MIRAGTVTLIRESPGAHGVGTDPDEIRRKVYCTVKSIGMQEAYQAMGIGLNPELKVILSHDFEYQGEETCELRGQRYKVLRTYVTEADGIELTLQRITGNAKALPEAEQNATESEGVG